MEKTKNKHKQAKILQQHCSLQIKKERSIKLKTFYSLSGQKGAEMGKEVLTQNHLLLSCTQSVGSSKICKSVRSISEAYIVL